jgi:hypothetical protein
VTCQLDYLGLLSFLHPSTQSNNPACQDAASPISPSERATNKYSSLFLKIPTISRKLSFLRYVNVYLNKSLQLTSANPKIIISCFYADVDFYSPA